MASFDPLRLLPTRDLTRKTLFLLALATAQTVGEIQAPLTQGKTARAGSSALSYLPEFIAKTDTEAHPRQWEPVF